MKILHKKIGHCNRLTECEHCENCDTFSGIEADRIQSVVHFVTGIDVHVTLY